MIRTGTRVRWNWGTGHPEGVVVERHEQRTVRTIDGEEITRNGTADNPALLIEQDDGDRVLKLLDEVERTDA